MALGNEGHPPGLQDRRGKDLQGWAAAFTEAADSFTVVGVDRNEHGLAELPAVRAEVAGTTGPAAATRQ
jgi:hypothetical protein